MFPPLLFFPPLVSIPPLALVALLLFFPLPVRFGPLGLEPPPPSLPIPVFPVAAALPPLLELLSFFGAGPSGSELMLLTSSSPSLTTTALWAWARELPGDDFLPRCLLLPSLPPAIEALSRVAVCLVLFLVVELDAPSLAKLASAVSLNNASTSGSGEDSDENSGSTGGNVSPPLAFFSCLEELAGGWCVGHILSDCDCAAPLIGIENRFGRYETHRL